MMLSEANCLKSIAGTRFIISVISHFHPEKTFHSPFSNSNKKYSILHNLWHLQVTMTACLCLTAVNRMGKSTWTIFVKKY